MLHIGKPFVHARCSNATAHYMTVQSQTALLYLGALLLLLPLLQVRPGPVHHPLQGAALPHLRSAWCIIPQHVPIVCQQQR